MRSAEAPGRRAGHHILRHGGGRTAYRLWLVAAMATVILFSAEFDRLSGFLTSFASDKVDNVGESLFSVYVFAGLVLLLLVLFFFFGRVWKEKLKQNALFQKVRAFMRELARGLTSVRHIENKVGFLAFYRPAVGMLLPAVVRGVLCSSRNGEPDSLGGA